MITEWNETSSGFFNIFYVLQSNADYKGLEQLDKFLNIYLPMIRQ